MGQKQGHKVKSYKKNSEHFRGHTFNAIFMNLYQLNLGQDRPKVGHVRSKTRS